MLLVVAFAYLLLSIGLARRDTMPGPQCASAVSEPRDQACGFTTGRCVLRRVGWRLEALLAAFTRTLTEWVEGNRG